MTIDYSISTFKKPKKALIENRISIFKPEKHTGRQRLPSIFQRPGTYEIFLYIDFLKLKNAHKRKKKGRKKNYKNPKVKKRIFSKV